MPVSFSQTAGTGTLNVQKSYALRHQIAQLGMVGDYQNYVARTGLNKSGAVIPFARLVAKDTANTDPQAVKEFDAVANVLLGISIITETMEKITSGVTPGFTYNTTGGYPDGYVVNVLSQGVVYVAARPGVAINIGDPVHYFFTGANKGTFGPAGVTAQSALLTQVRWLDSVPATSPDNNADRLVRLEIIQPGVGVTAS